jgi:hypothetical protein
VDYAGRPLQFPSRAQGRGTLLKLAGDAFPAPVICVENHATFRTLLRHLRALTAPDWIAVAWIQGRNTAPLESLPGLPFTVTRLDYLGDLDPPGLTIAATACAIAERSGIPAQPAAALWEVLLSQPSRPGNHGVSQADARKLAESLPASQRERASELLGSRQVIPPGSAAVRRACRGVQRLHPAFRRDD